MQISTVSEIWAKHAVECRENGQRMMVHWCHPSYVIKDKKVNEKLIGTKVTVTQRSEQTGLSKILFDGTIRKITVDSASAIYREYEYNPALLGIDDGTTLEDFLRVMSDAMDASVDIGTKIAALELELDHTSFKNTGRIAELMLNKRG